jgi:hypothetical protein
MNDPLVRPPEDAVRELVAEVAALRKQVERLTGALKDCVDTYAIEEVHGGDEDCGCLASVVNAALEGGPK